MHKLLIDWFFKFLFFYVVEDGIRIDQQKDLLVDTPCGGFRCLSLSDWKSLSGGSSEFFTIKKFN